MSDKTSTVKRYQLQAIPMDATFISPETKFATDLYERVKAFVKKNDLPRVSFLIGAVRDTGVDFTKFFPSTHSLFVVSEELENEIVIPLKVQEHPEFLKALISVDVDSGSLYRIDIFQGSDTTHFVFDDKFW